MRIYSVMNMSAIDVHATKGLKSTKELRSRCLLIMIVYVWGKVVYFLLEGCGVLYERALYQDATHLLLQNVQTLSPTQVVTVKGRN